MSRQRRIDHVIRIPRTHDALTSILGGGPVVVVM
jgi:hypothetical protein